MGKKLYEEDAGGIVIKSERKNGWFSVPNYVYDLWLPVLGSDAIGVYTTYCRVEMHGGVRKISLRSLAAACRIGGGKLNKINAKLERCGFIKVNKPEGYHRLMHWTTEIVMLDPPQIVTKELIEEFCVRGEYEPLTKWLFEENDAPKTPNSAPHNIPQSLNITPNSAPKIEDLDIENIEKVEFSAPKQADQTPTPLPIQEPVMVESQEPIPPITQEYPKNNPTISQEPFLIQEEENASLEPRNGHTTRILLGESVAPASAINVDALADRMSSIRVVPGLTLEEVNSALNTLRSMPGAHVYTAAPPEPLPPCAIINEEGVAVLPVNAIRVGIDVASPDEQSQSLIALHTANSPAYTVEVLPNGMKVATLNTPVQPTHAQASHNGRAAPAAAPSPVPDATPTKARQREIGQELLAHFCEVTGIIAPELNMDKQWKAAQKRWFQPLREIARICGWDVGRAKDRMNVAWGKFVGDGNQDWITAPQSLVETVRGISKGKGKSVPIPGLNGSGVVPLTEAHKNVSLFSQSKNGG